MNCRPFRGRKTGCCCLPAIIMEMALSSMTKMAFKAKGENIRNIIYFLFDSMIYFLLICSGHCSFKRYFNIGLLLDFIRKKN